MAGERNCGGAAPGSLKHEDVYLKGYADGREAKAGIGELRLLQRTPPSPGAGYRAPMAVWCAGASPGAYGTCGQRLRVDHMPTGG